MRMKGGSLAAPLCLQPLHLSCRHMVLKVKVSHQADEADVAGFHHVTNLLCHYRQSFSCFFYSFVCLFFNVPEVHILVDPLTVPTCISSHFVATQQT